ncbi:hypothetical protein CEXT_367341 [Caerostris extrusa]|uniref:C2H2-type domain-containing protein n=1 Tax=Caerostris extrusa TaxID=172846 RepID=A0AAV4VJ55_CAEEX|nr:hypothetical protein CEXT_367341 [Caerostris extrusa]
MHHLVVFRVLPIDTDTNPYLLRPVDISPSQPFYKETHLIGNPTIVKNSIPFLIKQKRLPPRPVISGPSKRKRKSDFTPFSDCVITKTHMRQGIPEVFTGGSVPAESPMALISRQGPIVKIVPRVLNSESVMWYKVVFPDMLSFNYVPGSSSTYSILIGTEIESTKANQGKKPSKRARPSKPEFWEYDGARFEASDDFDEEQYMCNQGLYFCDICKRKLKGISHLFRHVENHDT